MDSLADLKQALQSLVCLSQLHIGLGNDLDVVSQGLLHGCEAVSQVSDLIMGTNVDALLKISGGNSLHAFYKIINGSGHPTRQKNDTQTSANQSNEAKPK
jgi:hypothetical protein